MELFLNLIWMSLAVAAFAVFLPGDRGSRRVVFVPYGKSLFALACVVILLFPVVSASDDLHPTQAVSEEASKRVQLAVAPLHAQRTSPPPFTLLILLALCLLCSLVELQRFSLLVSKVSPTTAVMFRPAGRAPPFCWN